jgi:hypothetical protein
MVLVFRLPPLPSPKAHSIIAGTPSGLFYGQPQPSSERHSFWSRTERLRLSSVSWPPPPPALGGTGAHLRLLSASVVLILPRWIQREQTGEHLQKGAEVK